MNSTPIFFVFRRNKLPQDNSFLFSTPLRMFASVGSHENLTTCSANSYWRCMGIFIINIHFTYNIFINKYSLGELCGVQEVTRTLPIIFSSCQFFVIKMNHVKYVTPHLLKQHKLICTFSTCLIYKTYVLVKLRNKSVSDINSL